MKRPRQVFYADANAKVGKVKVYRCPHCRDGDDIAKLQAIAKAAAALPRESMPTSVEQRLYDALDALLDQ